jgi:hypothetical protein
MYKDNTRDTEVYRNLTSEVRRFHIINYLIRKYNLVNYLEIGVFNAENIRQILAPHKDAVDPGAEGIVAPEVNFPMTSDEFFSLVKGHEDIKYDIIFIDGLHHADQVIKDIHNSLNHLVDGGFIVMHDCNPPSYEAQKIPRETVAWNGDTWKAYVSFKINNPKYKSCVIDTDFGVGIIQKTRGTYNIGDLNLDYSTLEKDRVNLLNLVDWDEFTRTY